MKKILLLALILSLTTLAFAKSLGENAFSKEVYFYFASSGQNIFKIENEELTEIAKELEKYKNFENTNIENVISSGDYALCLKVENEKVKFAAVSEIPMGEFINTNFYNNSRFENEFIEGIDVSYILGDQQYIFAYYQDKLYISNDINIFFQMLGNIKGRTDSLAYNVSFQSLMLDKNDYDYKYYKTTEDLNKMGYNILTEAIFINDNKKVKYYYSDDQNIKDYSAIREYNFADFVLADVTKVSFGKNSNILIDYLKEDFEKVQYSDFKDLKSYLDNKVDMAGMIKSLELNYIVLYSQEGWENFDELLKSEYERAYFFNKKMDLNKMEYGTKFELPYLGLKKYISIVKNNYCIVSDDEEAIKSITIGKNKNYEYSKVLSNEEFSLDYKTNIKKILRVKDGLIKEEIINILEELENNKFGPKNNIDSSVNNPMTKTYGNTIPYSEN